MTRVQGTWVTARRTRAVLDILTGNGAEALFVGGCVRNALLGFPVNDVDIATDALPEDVMRWAGAAKLKTIPTGVQHGTVTVISSGAPFEITTFRRDIETDGRRAVVSFSKEVAEDARRRDFTINALYAKPDGTVVDPLHGMIDLQARRVRFIEDAAKRIEEDYLRTLRFFRFSAWYGDPGLGYDQDALSAIATHLDGLEALSKERVGSEVLKLLAAPDPSSAVATMRTTGVLNRILPGADDRALGPLIDIEQNARAPADALRRLAALSTDNHATHLRLSKAQSRLIGQLKDAAGSIMGPTELGYRMGPQLAADALMLRSALLETDFDEDTLTVAREASTAVFPVSAADLIDEYSGPRLGERLAKLESAWIKSGFSLSKDELLSRDT